MTKRYRNGWWLEIKYHREGMTQAEIASECGVTSRTIRRQMKRTGISTREPVGENHPLYGSDRPDELKERISDTLEGRQLSDQWREDISRGLDGNTIPEEVRAKISESLSGITRSDETRRKMSESTAGENNPNWKGGYSRRYGPGWSLARQRVRSRDEVCQACDHDGSDRRLEVHHVTPVREFREDETASLRDAHDLSNLVLLCRRCHAKADHGSIPVPDITPP